MNSGVKPGFHLVGYYARSQLNGANGPPHRFFNLTREDIFIFATPVHDLPLVTMSYYMIERTDKFDTRLRIISWHTEKGMEGLGELGGKKDKMSSLAESIDGKVLMVEG